MTDDFVDVIDALPAMQERVRSIRTRHLRAGQHHLRYLALSAVVSNLGKAIEDMAAERS
jgi:hypothetical protein